MNEYLISTKEVTGIAVDATREVYTETRNWLGTLAMRVVEWADNKLAEYCDLGGDDFAYFGNHIKKDQRTRLVNLLGGE